MNRDILHILSGLDRGGIESWLAGLLRRSAALRQRSLLCLTGPAGAESDGYYPLLRELGVPWVRLPYRRGWGRIIFLRELSALIRSRSIRCVNVHLNHLSAFGTLAALLGGARVRLAFHHQPLIELRQGARSRLKAHGLKALEYASATLVIACSRSVLESFGGFWGRRSRNRVLYCGLALEEFRSGGGDAAREEFGCGAEDRVIGTMGGLRPEKNHSFFLKVAAHLTRRDPRLRFLVVGDGPLRAELQEEATRLGLADRLVFTGARSDPIGLLRAMDLFLLPSRYEGFGLSLLEAQLTGLRGLASDRVPREVQLLPGQVRFLELEQGAERWAQAALELLGQGRLPQMECLRAAEERGFSLDRTIRRLEELYGSPT